MCFILPSISGYSLSNTAIIAASLDVWAQGDYSHPLLDLLGSGQRGLEILLFRFLIAVTFDELSLIVCK